MLSVYLLHTGFYETKRFSQFNKLVYAQKNYIVSAAASRCTMSSTVKSTAFQPVNKSTAKKRFTRHRQELLVFGYINYYIRNKKLRQKVPTDIMRLVYSFYQYHEIALAVVGASNSGKSTLAARILELCDKIPEDKLQALQETNHYAFYMDKTLEERQQGLTIHGACEHSFDLGRIRYTLLDTPGHRRYLNNAARTLCMADAAMLVIPVDNTFEACMQKANYRTGRIEGRARLFARICYILGIDQLIVAFNKFDTFQSDITAHERFIECKEIVSKFLKKLGFKIKRIPFVPISALHAQNIKSFVTDKDNASYLQWYKGFEIGRHKEKVCGFSLFDALRDCIEVKQRIFRKGIDKDFKMSILKRFKVPGIGHVLQGKIMHGSVQIGDKLRFYPSGGETDVCTVKSIQINYENVNIAESGVIASLCVTARRKEFDAVRLSLLSIEKAMNNRLKPCLTFTAMVYVVNHPHRLKPAKMVFHRYQKYRKYYNRVNEHQQVFVGGYTPNVSVSTWRCPCSMEKIEWVSRDQQRLTECDFLQTNDSAQVVFRPLQPMMVFSFDECQYYGRMLVLDNFDMVMMGKVMSVQYQK